MKICETCDKPLAKRQKRFCSDKCRLVWFTRYYGTLANPFRGRQHSSTTREKIKQARLGNRLSLETKRKLSARSKALWDNPVYRELVTSLCSSAEVRAKQSKAMKRIMADGTHLKKTLAALHSDEAHKKYKQYCLQPEIRHLRSIRMKANWSNPEWVKQALGAKYHPNKMERALDRLFAQDFPDQWTYVGDGKEGFNIGGRIPDWIHTDSKKIAIEFFGRYWHSRANPQFTPRLTEENTIAHYLSYGWNCIVIWQNELKNIVAIKEKVGQALILLTVGQILGG